jgi:hypothetical protein
VSRTERDTTSSVASPPTKSPSGAIDTRARLAFNPTRPQQEAGMRIEPPPSLACPIETIPDATAAPEPPLEPPGEWLASHGLREGP